MPANTAQTRRFFGLNNIADPLRMKFGWMQKADNIDITSSGAITRRDGYALALAGAMSGGFSTVDFSRLYVVDGGTLKQVNADMSTTTLRTGLSTRPMQWVEVNDQVFYTNGVNSGIILQDGEVIDWAWPVPGVVTLVKVTGTLPAGVYQVACTYTMPDGRETGASDASAIYLNGSEALQINDIPHATGMLTQVYIAPADSTVFQLAYPNFAGASATWAQGPDALGADLTTMLDDPLPLDCSYIAFWAGQVRAAQYFADTDSTAIWASEPFGYHLFRLDADFIIVPGKVTMLAAHDDALIIGTNRRIYAYDGENLKELAPYGAVPGWGAVKGDEGILMFWTQRGLCSALPFSNLTLSKISVDCGLSAGAAIIQENGAKKYVVALVRGGENFNQRGP